MTNFSWAIDGSIVMLYLMATMVAGLSVRKYVGKVEHFLVAGREMDVYLGVASLAATEFGIVTCMSAAELGYKHGFAGASVGITYALAMFVVGYTGFCVKPLRDSGVVTIAELFEQRFGPRIRWLSGVVIVLGGLLNMGTFLAPRRRFSGDGLRTGAGQSGNHDDGAAGGGGGLHDRRRHAVGAGHRLPAVHRDERRVAGGHVPDACQHSLEHAGRDRGANITARAGSIRW